MTFWGLFVFLTLCAIALIWIYSLIPKGLLPGFVSEKPPYKNPYNPNSHPGPNGEIRQVELEHGRVQYYLQGPKDGPRIVLVHGITPPALVFKNVSAYFASRGYRVLTFDLYGRGYSSSPDVPHDLSLYVGQLNSICESIGWNEFFLFGFSLGGAISVSYTSQYPHKVKKLILAAPAGLMTSMPLLGKLICIKGIGDIFVFLFGKKFLEKANARNFVGATSSYSKEVLATSKYQIYNHPGFMRSYLSTLRYSTLSGMSEVYSKVGQSKIPVLLIWGDADAVISYQHAELVQKFIPQSKLITRKGMNHNCIGEESDPLLPQLVDFLIAQN